MRRIAFALVVLILAGGAAAWWFWLRPSQAPDSRPTVAGPAAARETSQPPAADLMLQVNGGSIAQVRAGEPVFFTVSVLGIAPEPAFRLGAQGRPWPADLRFETADGRALTWHIDQLGATSVYRFVRDRRSGGPANAPARGTDDIVDASHVHLVDFGIGPDEAARLAAGSHRVRAVLALPSNSSGATHLVSNVVEIAVQASTAADDDTQRLESAAQFYLRSEKWEDAHRIARQLVGRQQPDASAYLLLGDALNGLRRDAESLAAYEAALAALPAPLAESPHYLFARMDEVQQRLEASKGKKEP